MSTPLITAISKLYNCKVNLLVFPTWQGSSSILKSEYVESIFENENYIVGYDLVIETWWGQKKTTQYDYCDKIIKAKQPNYLKQHEIEHNMNLARELGWSKETPKQWVKAEYQPKSKRNIKVIGIHSGCFEGIWEKKKYPYFKQLIMMLLKNKIVLNFGNEKEKINIKDKKYIEWAGNLKLQDTINEMIQCDYFIANDSGLMHIADALGIPLIALFGPTLITKNRPVNENSHILVNTMSCIPCQYTEDFNRCKDNKCLQFKPELIIDYMRKIKWI